MKNFKLLLLFCFATQISFGQNIRISALPKSAMLTGIETLPIVQGAVTKKTTVQDIAKVVFKGPIVETLKGLDSIACMQNGVNKITNQDQILKHLKMILVIDGVQAEVLVNHSKLLLAIHAGQADYYSNVMNSGSVFNGVRPDPVQIGDILIETDLFKRGFSRMVRRIYVSAYLSETSLQWLPTDCTVLYKDLYEKGGAMFLEEETNNLKQVINEAFNDGGSTANSIGNYIQKIRARVVNRAFYHTYNWVDITDNNFYKPIEAISNRTNLILDEEAFLIRNTTEGVGGHFLNANESALYEFCQETGMSINTPMKEYVFESIVNILKRFFVQYFQYSPSRYMTKNDGYRNNELQQQLGSFFDRLSSLLN